MLVHTGSREEEEAGSEAELGAEAGAGDCEWCKPCGNDMRGRDSSTSRDGRKQQQQRQEVEEDDDEEEREENDDEDDDEDKDEEKARNMLMFLLSIPYVDDAWGVHEIILDSLDQD